MAKGTPSNGSAVERYWAESITERERDVLVKALGVFILDRSNWSDPPHEEVGRAMHLRNRLEQMR